MITAKKNLAITIMNAVTLALIGAFSLLYVTHNSGFAELHVQLFFLDFPLFVGEMLFGGCLLLYGLKKWLQSPISMTKWNLVLIGYVVFVIIKLISGYIQFGPLACRHAAMFFYPLFGLFVYDALNNDRNSFILRIIVFVMALLSLMFFEVGYYYFPFIVFGPAIALSFQDRRLRIALLVLFLIMAPFKSLFLGARSIVLASLVATIYLVPMLTYTAIKKRYYRIVTVAILIVAVGCAYYFNTPEKIRESMTSVKKITALLEANDNLIKSREATYVPMDTPVKLYNPNNETTVLLPKTMEMDTDEERAITVVSPREYSDMVKLKEEVGVESGTNGLTLADYDGTIYKSGSITFRYNIFRDFIDQIVEERPVFGFPFGKPFRSKRLEMTENAKEEWSRDGWITSHNSPMEIIFRTGVVGLATLLFIVWKLVIISRRFFAAEFAPGILVTSAMIYWLICSLFIIIFEMPYYAIPVWSMFGILLALEANIIHGKSK